MHKIFHLRFSVPKKLYLFSLIFAIFGLSAAMIGSTFPLYLKEFSGSLFIVGLVGSITAIFATLSPIIIGNAVDKYGSKIFMLYGLFMTTFLYIGYYFAPFLSIVILLQILMGISRELIYTPFFTLIRDGSRKNVTESFSVIHVMSSVGYIVGPLIGGYLALTNLRIPFLYSAAMLGVAFTILLYLKPPKYVKRDVGLGLGLFKNAFRDFRLLGAEGGRLAFTTLTLNTWYSAKWFIGPLLLASLGFNTQDIGIWLSVSLIPFLLLSMPIASIIDTTKKNKISMIFWGLLLSAIPLMLLGFSYGMWLYLFIVAIAIGNVISDMVIEARMTEITPRNEYGEVTGVIESLKSAGGIIGPIITTYFADLLGIQYSLIPIFVMFLISIYFLTNDLKEKGVHYF